MPSTLLLLALAGCDGTNTDTAEGQCDTCTASVVEVFPEDGAVDVPVSPTIMVSVEPGNFVAAEILGPDGESVPGSAMAPESVSFEPFSRLEPQTSYTLLIKLGCGTENVEVCSEERLTFTTGTDPQAEPANQWFIASDIPFGLQSTHAPTVGNRPFNLQYPDQFGDPVDLHQFYGKTVQLSLTAMWCAPCQETAPELADVGPELQSQDIQVVEILLQNSDSEPPTVADAQLWASTMGADHPVLAGNFGDWEAWLLEHDGNFPVLPVLGPDLTVIEENNVPFDPELLESLAQ